MELTSTHEDYIEAVFRRCESAPGGIRISDLAEDLGCRLPTVTRTVKLLSEGGYFSHESRGLIRLTSKGAAIARDIAHRHDDVAQFLEVVLGVPSAQADLDACQIEHGLSPLAAARLHVFLNCFEELPASIRKKMQRATNRAGETEKEAQFANLVEIRSRGWRG